MCSAESLCGRDILDAFDRFRRDGNYSGAMTIDHGIVDAIVSSYGNETAGSSVGVEGAVRLMCHIARARPISTPPGEFTKPGHPGVLGSLDKYAVANETFAFDLGLRCIGLSVTQIAKDEDRLTARKIIARLALPDCQETYLCFLLNVLRMSVSR
jgi:hypothetical protein